MFAFDPPPRPGGGPSRFAAALAALTGAAVATTNVASADRQQWHHRATARPFSGHTSAPATTPRGDVSKPTVVFVHGGWADSSGWNAEIAAAAGQGLPRHRRRPTRCAG